MKLWIARDSDNTLWFYQYKPKVREGKLGKKYWCSIGDYWEIDEELFPSVTFKNSPQQVEIKLI